MVNHRKKHLDYLAHLRGEKNTLKLGSSHFVSDADFIDPTRNWVLKEIQLNCHSKTYSKYLGWESLWLSILSYPLQEKPVLVIRGTSLQHSKSQQNLRRWFLRLCLALLWHQTVYHCGWLVCFWKRNRAVCKRARIRISVRFSIGNKTVSRKSIGYLHLSWALILLGFWKVALYFYSSITRLVWRLIIECFLMVWQSMKTITVIYDNCTPKPFF